MSYHLFRPLLFSLDPEQAHQMAIGIGKIISSSPFLLDRLSAICHYDHPYLRQTVMGIDFNNPLGLAAGFDKNAEVIPLWQALGFGFAEVGTITPFPQTGNPKPRLFRLLKDEAILNRMGFNNDGAQAIAERLKEPNCFPLGINLGKQKETPIEKATDDYVHCFQLLEDKGHYFVINVSSPNTPQLRNLQSVHYLHDIITAIQKVNEQNKPILVKIAPDLADQDIMAIVDLCLDRQIAGIIATNTTITRQNLQTNVLSNGKRVAEEEGGISGLPLQQRSNQVIHLIWQHSAGKIPIVGVGGIHSPADAWAKLTAGASLLQIYTGLVYRGPGLIRDILTGIVDRMKQHSFTNIKQVIGSNRVF